MLNLLRNLRKSTVEKREERTTAFVDGALSAADRQLFEQEMAADPVLRAEVEQLQALKTALRQIPPRRVPRNFTLDPALVGRPQPAGLTPIYPAMRLATALTAFFFIFAIALSFFNSGQIQSVADAPSVAREMAAEETISATVEIASEVESAPAADEGAMDAVDEESGEAAEMEGADATLMMEEAEMPAEMAAPEAEMMAEAEEVMEEDAVGAPASTPTPATTPELMLTAEVVTSETTTADVVEDSAANAGAPAATSTPSVLPRPPSPTPEPDRALEGATADDFAADDTVVEEVAEEETVVLPPPRPRNLLQWVQLGLGLLLVVLAALTLYTRRQL
jgi:hypothetical protein